MAVSRKRLLENLQRVRDRIAESALKAGRDPEAVRLVAITKSADLDDIKALIELGVNDLGESRVQQLVSRAEELAQWVGRRRKETPAYRWHMVGHLQRNKVRQVLDAAEVVHSVDSLRLAEEIDRRGAQIGRVTEVMLQVNCSEEPQKFGVAVGASSHLTEQMCTLEHLRVIGLMTMAPLDPNPEKARPTFTRLREIFEDMRRDKVGGSDLRHLSMGMTQDYPVAVEEGATMVRIGTALFS
ncbi:MAG TPA: YggS family pyridoxal phosphate-dependent enzyme [Phycisphaerae bacterium]|nr:YggS family pyridoxal phosphate-dependent enzyme [Phycisphaerae bacterium]